MSFEFNGKRSETEYLTPLCQQSHLHKGSDISGQRIEDGSCISLSSLPSSVF